MKQDLITQFNLPSYIKGKSFAEASKAIQDKFKDRTDPYSQDTMEELLQRLQQAQEYVKQMNQPEPDTNQMAMGGPLTLGQGIGMASTALEFGNQLFSNPENNMDMTGNTEYEMPSKGMSAASGAVKGASTGAALGPWGAAAGAVIGGVSGLVGANKKQKAINESIQNKNLRTYNQSMNTYAKGGYTNKYDGITNPSGYLDTDASLYGASEIDYSTLGDKKFGPTDREAYDSLVNSLETTDEGNYFPEQEKMEYSTLGNKKFGATNSKEFTDYIQGDANLDGVVDKNKDKSNEKSWLERNYGNILRLGAPLSNAYQLATMNKPEVERYNRLDNKYKPQYLDEKTLQNTINESFNPDAMTEASGGSLGRLGALNLGQTYNKARATSEAYQNVKNRNIQENITGQQFNLGVDQINLGVDTQEKIANAQNRAAYDTNKSRLISALGENVSGVGDEIVRQQRAESLTGYNWMGKYSSEAEFVKEAKKLGYTPNFDGTFDYNGKTITAKELEKEMAKKK